MVLISLFVLVVISAIIISEMASGSLNWYVGAGIIVLLWAIWIGWELWRWSQEER